MNNNYTLAVLKRYWVLSNKKRNLEFLHLEDLSWTTDLHCAMKFETINEAQRHRKEMIAQSKEEEQYEDERLCIYYQTIPREIRLSMHF